MHPTDRLLTPGEVAELFRVGPKTVTRWAAEGKLNSIRTPGRHRRFAESQVRALLEGAAAAADPIGADLSTPRSPATTSPATGAPATGAPGTAAPSIEESAGGGQPPPPAERDPAG